MNTRIYDEASEWFVRHRTETLDETARRQFDEWLRDSPQHVRAYFEISDVWEEASDLKDIPGPGEEDLIAWARSDRNVVPFGIVQSAADPHDHRPGESPVYERSTGSSTVQDKRGVEAPKGARKPRWLLLAAAPSLAVACIAIWYFGQSNTYSTTTGEQRTIALSDGSTVELNARSEIRLRYTDAQRTIDLIEGQAFFKVAKDPLRPFIVASNGTRVRAVGTQFDVYRKTGQTVVTVVEGRVTVSSAEDSAVARDRRDAGVPGNATGEIVLTAGDQLLHTTAAASVRRPADIESSVAWTQQRLIFDFSPLTEVAEEFNRYNRRPLVISDPTLRDFNVSGSFSSTDPTLLLQFLRAQPEISISETENEIRISRRPTE